MVAPIYSHPDRTGDVFWINQDLFRSRTVEEKEIKSENRQKVIILDGAYFDVEETYVVISKAKDVRYNRLLFDAVEYINANAPVDLVQQARAYIDELNKRTFAYESLELPPFSVSLPEDGTLLIEWDFEHFTIGISFEQNPEDSGWYIVNDGRIKKTTAWGYLNSRPMSDLIELIIGEALGDLRVPAS